MPSAAYDILVDRKDLAAVVVEPAATLSLGADQVRVRLDLFALTANNVTYGVAGDTMKYWNFFPARAGMGRIPVWGFGTVTESTAVGVAVGERLYGYWPMSSETVLTTAKTTAHTLTETSGHRAGLAAVYNTYARVAADPTMPAGSEPYVSLIRPLFTTSFLIDDFLADNQFFGADSVVLTSASSKTAIGLAHCLAQRGGVRIIGLTSAGNVAFVKRLGTYSDVIAYDATAGLSAPGGAVVVDMAGGEATLRAVHTALGAQLKYSCRVGFTQWQDAAAVIKDLPGVRPVFFFAPDRVKVRMQDWGPAGFMSRVGAASAGFVAAVRSWMTLETHTGPDAITAAYRHVVAGDAPPDAGIICRP